MLATFLQKFARLSVPPNSAVKIVESGIRMCLLPVPLGGRWQGRGDLFHPHPR